MQVFTGRVMISPATKCLHHRSASILACNGVNSKALDVLKARGHQVIVSEAAPWENPAWNTCQGVFLAKSPLPPQQVAFPASASVLSTLDSSYRQKRSEWMQLKKNCTALLSPPLQSRLHTEVTLAHMLKYGTCEGQSLGVIGLAMESSQALLKIGKIMGMQVRAYDPWATLPGLAPAAQLGLDECWATSDVVVINGSDLNIILSKERLDMAKEGMRLVLAGRELLLEEEEALLHALSANKIDSVAMDKAPQSLMLLNHPKFFITPTSELQSSLASESSKDAECIAKDMADIIDGNNVLNGKFVVNVPNIDWGQGRVVDPYRLLGHQMGSLLAQLLPEGERVLCTQVIVQGETISEQSDGVVAAVLKGILNELRLEEDAHWHNSREVAEKLGISFEEHRQKNVTNQTTYANQLTVVLDLGGGKQSRLTGTVMKNEELRLTNFDDLQMDVVIPSGTMLFFRNNDKPGVLRKITDFLASKGANIVSFGLGRGNSNAMGVLTLDEPLDGKTLSEIKELPDIHDIRQVHMVDFPSVPGRVAQFPSTSVGSETVGIHIGRSDNLKPLEKPRSPQFGSGPCKKRPGYDLSNLPQDVLGRSHRSRLGKHRLAFAIEETKRILGIPNDYLLGIVPASDTGAFEMAMWNLLGERPVDICYWESFGKGWYTDAVSQLLLNDTVGVREFTAEYGKLPDLKSTNPDHDICLTWNGTTSGVKVPNGNWIPCDRKGLVFNDATSAAFAMDIPWTKTDVSTFSWQKVLGGEGGHGMLVLSPRAVSRLENFTPLQRPMPKIFRMKKSSGKLMHGIFGGSTINTPSMLCVEDYLDALRWADRVGGLPGLIARSESNLGVLERFVEDHPWISFLVKDSSIRSNTSVCLSLDLPKDKIDEFRSLLEKECVAFDIGSYRDAPDGLRIWCGATVEKEDLEALCPWLKWAYHEVKK